MKLQVAFDIANLSQALQIAHDIDEFTHSFEIGALLIYENGLEAVRAFKKKFPHKSIVCDVKIADHANESVILCAHAGADWITVLAGTQKSIIYSAAATAHTYGKKIILDLIDASSLGQSALEAKSLGVDALLVQLDRSDDTNATIQDIWDIVRGNTDLPIYVSGIKSQEIIDQCAFLDPHMLVVSRHIIDQHDPRAAAKKLFEKLTQSS